MWDQKPRPSHVKISPSLRSRVFKRDGFSCVAHLSEDCTGEANAVDHIKNVAEGGSNALSNLRAICDPCHAIKTQQEANRGKKRYHDRAKTPTQVHPAYVMKGR